MALVAQTVESRGLFGGIKMTQRSQLPAWGWGAADTGTVSPHGLKGLRSMRAPVPLNATNNAA